MDTETRRHTAKAAAEPAFETGRLAYITSMGAVKARSLGLLPDDAKLPEGIKLFVVHAADGTPLAITDTWDAAYGAALQNELVPLSVH